MRINILTDIIGRKPSEEVEDKLLDTVNKLWLDFDSVPEVQSQIEVELFTFIFRFRMEDKVYRLVGNDMHITLIYKMIYEEYD
tara:strand:+ start:1598 stop:1846 length:249 start_codon:yes stop_codon:yes gene_type:complete